MQAKEYNEKGLGFETMSQNGMFTFTIAVVERHSGMYASAYRNRD